MTNCMVVCTAVVPHAAGNSLHSFAFSSATCIFRIFFCASLHLPSEAKEKNREGWYMAYIMDTNEEERVKGITVEVRASGAGKRKLLLKRKARVASCITRNGLGIL